MDYDKDHASEGRVDKGGKYGDWHGLPVPFVVVAELRRRPKLSPHIIVFANEKGGVGKSTLAFHSCAALCHSGARVLVVDLDNRQRSLAVSFEMREATARTLNASLPSPKCLALEKQSGAALDQEIRRAGVNVDFVIIDLPGADTATARYAIALADTIVTPIGSSAYDVNGLARLNSVTRKLAGRGHFADLVDQIRSEKAKVGLPIPDWIVIKNRLRAGERRLEQMLDAALDEIAANVGFRIGNGLPESLSFRDLNGYGLTYLDIGLIPGLGKRNHRVEKVIGNLLQQYDLPTERLQNAHAIRVDDRTKRERGKAKVSEATSRSYWNSLVSHRLPRDS